MNADPLTVTCSHCGAVRGQRCVTASGGPRQPHKTRARLALALTAHADPALDPHFHRRGPCGICGTPGLDQRHRVVDAIAGRLAAGEDAQEVARDYGLPDAAVAAVVMWMNKWPGAWR